MRLPLPCALVSARRPGARGRRLVSLPQTLVPSPSPRSPQRARPGAFGVGAPGWVQTVVMGKSRSPPALRGLRLPGWTGLGVWSVLQEVGTPSEDLRRPETAGGPRGSERGGVASPVLRVNEKHPTPRVPGYPPRQPHHGGTVSARSACTASRCLRGDTGTLGFRRVPLTKHMMGGGLTQMDIREDSHM